MGFYCPYGMNMGPMWAEVYESAHGMNMGPMWAEVYESAHMGHEWVKYGLEYLVH